jgi:putative FmdB family regulatory protein
MPADRKRFIRRTRVPLYEYECTVCHHRFEKIESFSAPVTQKCLNCGEPAERLLAAPAIQFKGSGWYVTDYARKNSGPSPASSSTQAGKSGDGASVGGGAAEKSATSSAGSEKSPAKKD